MGTHAVRMSAAAALAAILTLSGTAAYATAPISPDTGGTAGGTVVQFTAPGPHFTQLSAGQSHTLALSDGTAYAWGNNGDGQLGVGDTDPRTVPNQVDASALPSGVSFTQLDAGRSFSLGLASNGTVYAWGSDSWDALGISAGDDSTTVPALVPGITGATAIAAGDYTGFALLSTGRIAAWGLRDIEGYLLGDGAVLPFGSAATPVLVSQPAGVDPDFAFTQVSVGSNFALALGNDGKAYAWGSNDYGQLGDNTTTDRSTPVEIDLSALGAAHVATLVAGAQTAYAIDDAGIAYSWGFNYAGQLGNGTNDPISHASISAPITMSAGVTVTQLAAGPQFALALGSDGAVYGWGQNEFGQLGDPDHADNTHLVPAVIADTVSASITAISAAGSQSFGLASGRISSWGANLHGQLGNGTMDSSDAPTFLPGAVVTAVTFGGVAGTNLHEVSPGVWEVTTPALAKGAADMEIAWSYFDTAQTPVTLADAFTYSDGSSGGGGDDDGDDGDDEIADTGSTAHPGIVTLAALSLVVGAGLILNRIARRRTHRTA